jgi:hypothetical protein
MAVDFTPESDAGARVGPAEVIQASSEIEIRRKASRGVYRLSVGTDDQKAGATYTVRWKSAPSLEPAPYARDEAATRLRTWVKEGPGNEKALADWLKANNINASVPMFIYGTTFRDQREQVVKELVRTP